jgi:hypothetical protein
VQFTVRVLASTLKVELDDSLSAEARARILDQWAHLRVTDRGEGAASMRLRLSGDSWQAEAGLEEVVAADAASAPDTLASHLTLFGLRELSGHAFLFHAAGLATDDGSVIALVGPSGRGKTTASQALGQTFGYVTDETVAFDVEGIVTSYPKPLSIGHRPTPKVLYPPAELGLTVATGPLRLGALVLLEREPGRADVLIEHVPLVDALPELAPQSSSLWKMPSALSRLAGLVGRTGGVRRVRYGDAQQLPPMVGQILDARAPDEEVFEPLEVLEAEGGAGLVARAPFTEAVVQDGRLVVLGPQGLHVLEGIGPAVWLAADGVSVDTIEQRVDELVGSAPDGVDGKTAITQAIDQLRANRLLH